ncbi:MAG: hypothetical protein V1686_01840 [Patescibacteria group bacterium]
MKEKIYLVMAIILIFMPSMNVLAEDSIPLIQNLLPSRTTTNADQPAISLNMLELVWNAETYTPLEYQGRALPTKGSMVDVDAVISVSGGSTSNLKFSWFLDDTFQESKSGYGKTSFRFGVRKFSGSSHNVLVKIFNDDRSFYTEKSIDIPICEPEVVLTQSNTNLLSIVAKPYFFYIKKLTDLIFEWTLAGQEPIISSNYNASILDISISNRDTTETAEQTINLSVKRNSTQIIQNAYNSIKINL